MTELTGEYTHPVLFNEYSQLLWTEGENQRLINSYKKIPKDRLMELFPDRTWCALVTRAYRLKIPRKKRWFSLEEDTLLIMLYHETDLTYDQMSQRFVERNGNSLKQRRYALRKKHMKAKKRQMEAGE